MTKKASPPKSDATKTWITWGRQALESLQEKGVNLGGPQADLTRRIDAMVMSRAYTESMNKPKIHLRYEYPLELFLQKAGGAKADVFERSLPSHIEIAKLFIPFADGSVLLIQTPSEDTVQCATYLKMLVANPELAGLMSADGPRLGALKEVIDVVFGSNRVAALGSEDVSKFLSREASIAQMGHQHEPKVQVNLASAQISASQAVGVLLDFFQTPTDTISTSVNQFIAHEFALKTN